MYDHLNFRLPRNGRREKLTKVYCFLGEDQALYTVNIKRERDKRDRQTDRQTDRQRQRQIQTQSEYSVEVSVETEKHRETQRQREYSEVRCQ